MNPVNYFEQEGFLIVSKRSREEVARLMSDILKYYPPISANIDDYSLRKNYEIFYAKLKKCYPDIFLMDMYGVNYLWQHIENYNALSKNSGMSIKKSALRIYEILLYLNQSIPYLKGLDEMPTVSDEKETTELVVSEVTKECTHNQIVKKVESALSLVENVCDFFNSGEVKKYYTKLKQQLDKEFILKNNTRCEFENILYQKCLVELEKCKEVKSLSFTSGINNVKELAK